MKSSKIRIFFSNSLQNARLREICWVAVLYVITARIGQSFAIEPANVTPVWIPSGVMLALALYRGPQIWPGIFLGAFLGNIWAYFSLSSLTVATSAIAAATLNGIGDALALPGIAILIKSRIGKEQPIESLNNLLCFFVLGVVVGPTLSAVFGVGGLSIFGFIEGHKATSIFFTWLIGDATGALLFTPLIYSWLTPRESARESTLTFVACVIYSLILATLSFDIIRPGNYFLYTLFLGLPGLFFILFNSSQRLTFTVQVVVISVAIVATAFNKGPFAEHESHIALLKLQMFSSIFSLVLYIVAIFGLEKAKSKALLEQRKNELEQLYRLDALTQLWNRYRIQEFIEIELARFRREHRPFGVILIDIDDFKKINDQYGHNTGDKVLVELSQLIKSQIRESDLLGRWGGEEFILIASDTSIESLTIFAEKIRQSIESYRFSVSQKITVSLGLTLVTLSDSELSLLDRADEALYRSKRSSKNCVSVYENSKA